MDATGVGEPKGAARQGVVTVLRPNRSPAQPGTDPTPDAPGVRVFAPPVYRHHYDGARWSTKPGALPIAAYACHCGQTGTATGPEKVAALVAEYDAHKSACTGAPAAPAEGRNAA
ncbi:hypothetical protein [Streptomyces sp. SCL15-6]|uniref:hypothetical protein n=1 Tax=Streptomyces sp. SCL15-6 TaxID=2967222 RepID=UPI0029665437|nr:hypothetical protein [Streptomyces sp. SCL15-6]